MKKKGMTLIESVITIALLGIMFLLIAPLIRTFSRVDNRVKTQKEIDAEFSVINEFIQKKVRSAKDTSGTGQYAIIIDSSSTTKEGIGLQLEIPVDSSTTPDSVSFIFNETEQKLEYTDGSTTETLMENVNDVNFKFEKGIVIYYIDLNLNENSDGNFRDTLRGSASTRIDIESN